MVFKTEFEKKYMHGTLTRLYVFGFEHKDFIVLEYQGRAVAQL